MVRFGENMEVLEGWLFFKLLLFNVLKQLQMVLAFVFKLWKSWEGNVMFERRMSSFGLLAEVNIPTPDRR